MNYRHYLRVRGITHIYKADTLSVDEAGISTRRRMVRGFLRLRDRMLTRIVEHIERPDDRYILAAMTLGFRQGMDRGPIARIYPRSGMIHLVAISGLHVGVLFTVLLLS